MAAVQNTTGAFAGIVGGAGTAITIKWAWDGMYPENPMPNEVALFIASTVGTFWGSLLPEMWGMFKRRFETRYPPQPGDVTVTTTVSQAPADPPKPPSAP